jgi:hypothetical protein
VGGTQDLPTCKELLERIADEAEKKMGAGGRNIHKTGNCVNRYGSSHLKLAFWWNDFNGYLQGPTKSSPFTRPLITCALFHWQISGSLPTHDDFGRKENIT